MTFIALKEGNDIKYFSYWSAICFKPKNTKITYISADSIIRSRHKLTMVCNPINIEEYFNILMKQEGLDITIPNNMSIECYNIKSPGTNKNKFEIDKRCILTYTSSVKIDLDYNKFYSILITLSRYEDDNVQKLSNLIMEDIIINIKTINITTCISDISDDIIMELTSYLSAYCTNYHSYRICYICIGLLTCLYNYKDDRHDIVYKRDILNYYNSC